MNSANETSPGGLSVHRILALADGVFAIAMTLLVLEFKVPNVAAGELGAHLAKLWPTFVIYAATFIIVGVYWVGHHNMFHEIRRSDRSLMGINIFFLLCIAFIPFPANVLGQFPRQPAALALYGATLIVTGLLLELIWVYATGKRRLVNASINPKLVRYATGRTLRAPILYAGAIGLAFWRPALSLILFVIVPLTYLLPTRIDEHWRG